MPCIVSGTGRECSVSASPSDGAREQSRRGARPRGGVNSARPLTAFPALSSPDNSEAGLRLRISFLFWLTIAQKAEILHPVRMSWRLLVVSYRAPRSRKNRPVVALILIENVFVCCTRFLRIIAMAHPCRPSFGSFVCAIRELVSNKPCAILAASWSVSGDGQCRDETR